MSERTLVLLRHGKSDWSGDEPDVDRLLAPRGRRQAPEAGRWLAGHLTVDLAVVSAAQRARATWELAAAQLEQPPPVLVEEQVYAATAGELLDVVRSLPDEVHTAVMVGHNPGLEDLAQLLTRVWVELPTSALAVIDLSGPWAAAGEATGTLRSWGRPPGG